VKRFDVDYDADEALVQEFSATPRVVPWLAPGTIYGVAPGFDVTWVVKACEWIQYMKVVVKIETLKHNGQIR
jgi:hypothetical protein